MKSCEDNEQGGLVLTKKETINGPSKISGSVKSQLTNEPISFAAVFLRQKNNSGIGTLTDAVNGSFSFTNLSEEDFVLDIEAQGYYSLSVPVVIKKNTAHTIDISLCERKIYVEKPLVYLYPTQKQNVQVKLLYNGTLKHTYPTYPSTGWNVTALPGETLFDQNEKEYYGLLWEGIPNKAWAIENGFVVSGKETITFLEDKLAYLGLSRREANEFIIYWLPRLENNPYNLIHFSGRAYEALAKLEISPLPETIIRVMMLSKPLNEKIRFPLQDLSELKKTRKGFTVVEWGGCVLD